MSEGNSWKETVGYLVGFIVFAGVWIYAISEWGLLFGLLFGWLPAIIGAFVSFFLWPLAAIFIVWLLISSL